MALDTLIQRCTNLRKLAAQAKKEWKALLHQVEEADGLLIDAMIEADLKSVKCEDGSHWITRRSFFLAVTKNNVAQIREWLNELGVDEADFVRESISKSALKRQVEEWISDGAMEVADLPAFLRASSKPGLTIKGLDLGEADGESDDDD